MHLYPVFPHCLARELIVLNTHLNIRVLFNYQVNNIPQCRWEAFPRSLRSPPRLPSPHRAWNMGQGRPRQGRSRGQPAGPPACLTSLQGSMGEQSCMIWRPGLQFKVELCILKSCTGCLVWVLAAGPAGWAPWGEWAHCRAPSAEGDWGRSVGGVFWGESWISEVRLGWDFKAAFLTVTQLSVAVMPCLSSVKMRLGPFAVCLLCRREQNPCY